MKRSTRIAVALATAATLAGLLPVSPAQAAGTTYTDAEIAAMTPAAQDRLLGPLRRVANAVDAFGREGGAAYYSGLALDGNHGSVTVYLTDTGRKDAVLAAARRSDKGADVSLLRFARGAYSRKELQAAREQVLDRPSLVATSIESVSVPPTGEGLKVRVAQGTALTAAKAPAQLFGVPVTVETVQGSGEDKSRRRDERPWIGGAALTASYQNDAWTCTSGIPARRNYDNRWFLITAAHCYNEGDEIYTGPEGGGRNHVGRLAYEHQLYDAAAIDTSNTGPTLSWVWEGGQDNATDAPIDGYKYSYYGDWVCQSGFTSGQVCGIHVLGPDVKWTGSNGQKHRGVEGVKDDGIPSRGGDSGGLVWTYTSNGRQARGLVSWGDPWGTMRWTEATDILGAWGMSLA
ncbi:hypothetical protein Afil01_27480 [Actinorhabdospora filicis]|uniref:Trypsin-like serine protease n=1 Tax=Actinorhabdospora filicis TaxID=1785913 RepID=A0A9W6SLF9_9ACTN|nr:hypothetical protein [Actinorhabdospora filicis]GLZ77941.1 hypothetical protein Afil01_27480 [Actinorhabdospora filicis]